MTKTENNQSYSITKYKVKDVVIQSQTSGAKEKANEYLELTTTAS